MRRDANKLAHAADLPVSVSNIAQFIRNSLLCSSTREAANAEQSRKTIRSMVILALDGMMKESDTDDDVMPLSIELMKPEIVEKRADTTAKLFWRAGHKAIYRLSSRKRQEGRNDRSRGGFFIFFRLTCGVWETTICFSGIGKLLVADNFLSRAKARRVYLILKKPIGVFSGICLGANTHAHFDCRR